MIKKEERILLYQFPENQISAVREVCRSLGIHLQMLPAEAWREKVGYLLGRKGFKPASSEKEGIFKFSHRLILFENIQGKRLTKVLSALEEADVPRITYKSAITPYNILWTLCYLCEHMAKEHTMPTGKPEREGDK